MQFNICSQKHGNKFVVMFQNLWRPHVQILPAGGKPKLLASRQRSLAPHQAKRAIASFAVKSQRIIIGREEGKAASCPLQICFRNISNIAL